MDKAKEQAVTSPVKPGPETLALKRFHMNSTWTGTVKAGAMGPGSPEMSAKGESTFKWIMDGLWVVGDFEQDQFVADKKVLMWKAHYVAGWDFEAQEYRALVVDNNGRSTVFSGKIEGDRLIIVSMSDVMIEGQSLKLRMTWDLTDPKTIKWLNEGSINGGSWTLIEDYVCTPSE